MFYLVLPKSSHVYYLSLVSCVFCDPLRTKIKDVGSQLALLLVRELKKNLTDKGEAANPNTLESLKPWLLEEHLLGLVGRENL